MCHWSFFWPSSSPQTEAIVTVIDAEADADVLGVISVTGVAGQD